MTVERAHITDISSLLIRETCETLKPGEKYRGSLGGYLWHFAQRRIEPCFLFLILCRVSSPTIRNTVCLLCWNLICGNAIWHHTEIVGQFWHKHLITIFTTFKLFSLVIHFYKCVFRLFYLRLWVCIWPVFFWFIFAHFLSCFLNFTIMNLLITKH